MIQLNAVEREAVRSQRSDLRRAKFSYALPRVFTEHGVLMLASVLNSEVAVQASVQIVRVFIQMRETLATHLDLKRRLDDLEDRYDDQFKVVFDALRDLTTPPDAPTIKIGFRLTE